MSCRKLLTPAAGAARGAGLARPCSTARNSFSDTRITTAVKMGLYQDTDVPGTSVNVDTRDGVVTLFGAVPNEAAKDKATTLASKVSGVLRVENQLEVVPDSQKKIVDAKDDAVEKALKARFKDRSELKDVKYEVKNGAVRLTGTVATAWQKLEAMRLARTTDGVKKISEELMVRPAKGAHDEPLRQN